MPSIPAFCDNCGFIFNSGYSFGGNVQNIQMTGNKSQCTNCGNMADIPDGLYNVVNNTINLLKGPDISVQRLKTLKRFVTDLRDKELTKEQLSKTITKEAPELSSIVDALPKTRNELYAFLAVLISLITMLIGTLSKDEKPNININNVFNNYNQEFVDQRKEVKKIEVNTSKKQGRNEKCKCASGLKYKKCCGKPN
jgi:hypothetical protein